MQLDAYSGPMDLLLYLIRRDEIDIHDIPIARLTQQYLAYVDLLQRIDPESVGEFLVLAATLMEIKSRSLLPRPPVEEEATEDWVDPRMELVRQLLQYKTYKDAARALEASAREQALKHPRQPVVPETPQNEIDLEDAEVWTLLEAFQRLLEEIGQGEPQHEVAVDDTPIALYAEDILDSLERAGGVQPFSDVFVGRTRAEMIGLFLALLELVRERRVQARQEAPLSTILLYLLDATPIYGAMETHGQADAPGAAATDVVRPAEWGKGIPESARATVGEDDRSEEEALDDEEDLGEAFALPDLPDAPPDFDPDAGPREARAGMAPSDLLEAERTLLRGEITSPRGQGGDGRTERPVISSGRNHDQELPLEQDP